MPEYINYKVSGDGVAVGVTASYVVEVHRPDGTWDRKQAYDMEHARQLVSTLVDGKFPEEQVFDDRPICPTCGGYFTKATWNQVYCDEHKRSR